MWMEYRSVLMGAESSWRMDRNEYVCMYGVIMNLACLFLEFMFIYCQTYQLGVLLAATLFYNLVS